MLNAQRISSTRGYRTNAMKTKTQATDFFFEVPSREIAIATLKVPVEAWPSRILTGLTLPQALQKAAHGEFTTAILGNADWPGLKTNISVA